LPGNRTRLLAGGFLVGATAGLVWTWRRIRRIAREGPPGLVDWERVRAVAGRYCQDVGVAAGAGPYFADLVGRSIQEVANYTGQQLPNDHIAIRILNRQQWLDTNVQTFRTVLQPLEDIYHNASSPRNPLTVLFGSPLEAFLSQQMGLLLGYLAQRVLGQYDIALLGREPLQDGQMYFVEPNIRGTQVQLGLSGQDFPLWVALHETTHAFEFETHPWLRGHFNTLLRDYLSDLETEVDRISELLSPAALGELLKPSPTGESWLLRALTPHQRQVFDQMQALMCIVEGYSNHVMKQVGRQVLPTFDLIEARIAARQSQRTPMERLFIRLTGLELKMEQYQLGEHFAEVVVQQRGLPFLHRVWEQAANLPTMEEIGHPEQWVARMEASGVTTGR
jgi:coenzyme F420 biosynthesis associated uncharacterized protein